MATTTQKTLINIVANKHNVNAEWLEWVIFLESNFNPQAKNPSSSASGLLQWIEATAKGLGTTTEKIQKMSFVQQMDIVDLFIKKNKKLFSRAKTFIDYYLIIFYPAAVGMDMNYIFPAVVTKYNPAFDTDKNGLITKLEFAKHIEKRLSKYTAVGSLTDYPTVTTEQKAGYFFEDNFALIAIIITIPFLYLISK